MVSHEETHILGVRFFEYTRKSKFTEGIRPLYNQYRQSILPRQPEPGLATTTFNASKDQWDDEALALCSAKQSNRNIHLMSEGRSISV